ncbi:hypothetical protein U1Q18_017192 [Sarracenia purpurea var. burkii]
MGLRRVVGLVFAGVGLLVLLGGVGQGEVGCLCLEDWDMPPSKVFSWGLLEMFIAAGRRRDWKRQSNKFGFINLDLVNISTTSCLGIC